jgi:ketopantoate reductase
VPEAAASLRPPLGERTFVVPLQNGIEAPDQLAAVLGPERVLGGFCSILASLDGPGRIRHMGVTPYIAFGELDGSMSARRHGGGAAGHPGRDVEQVPVHHGAERGRRPSELEAQVGAVVRLGERLGVTVPVHRTIYAALLPQERRARAEVASK